MKIEFFPLYGKNFSEEIIKCEKEVWDIIFKQLVAKSSQRMINGELPIIRMKFNVSWIGH